MGVGVNIAGKLGWFWNYDVVRWVVGWMARMYSFLCSWKWNRLKVVLERFKIYVDGIFQWSCSNVLLWMNVGICLTYYFLAMSIRKARSMFRSWGLQEWTSCEYIWSPCSRNILCAIYKLDDKNSHTVGFVLFSNDWDDTCILFRSGTSFEEIYMNTYTHMKIQSHTDTYKNLNTHIHKFI